MHNNPRKGLMLILSHHHQEQEKRQFVKNF